MLGARRVSPRDWMQAYAPPEINGIPVSQVGSGLVDDVQLVGLDELYA